jgi:hypothetical protein
MYKYFKYRVIPNLATHDFNNKLVQFTQPSLNHSPLGTWVKAVQPSSHFLLKAWKDSTNKLVIRFNFSPITLTKYSIELQEFWPKIHAYTGDDINSYAFDINDLRTFPFTSGYNISTNINQDTFFSINWRNESTDYSAYRSSGGYYYKYINQTNTLEEYDMNMKFLNRYTDAGINIENYNDYLNSIVTLSLILQIIY